MQLFAEREFMDFRRHCAFTKVKQGFTQAHVIKLCLMLRFCHAFQLNQADTN